MSAMDEIRGKLEGSQWRFQQILGCAICLEYAKSPMKTQCNHYFCNKCLDSLFKASKNPTPCPICKNPVSKRGLQKCPQLESIIKTLSKLSSALESDCLSLAELTTSDQLEKKEDKSLTVISPLIVNNKKLNKKTDQNRKNKQKLATSKTAVVLIEKVPSIENVNNYQNENICKEDIKPAIKQAEENVSKMDLEDSNSKVNIVTDVKECNTEQGLLNYSARPPSTSYTDLTKVSKWLSNYCISPAQSMTQDYCDDEDEHLSTAVKVEERSNNDKVSGDKYTKRPKPIYNASDNIDSTPSEEVENDPFTFIGTQNASNKSQNITVRRKLKRTTKKKDSSTMFTLLEKCSRPTRVVKKTEEKLKAADEVLKIDLDENDDVKRDPYALFSSPVSKRNELKTRRKLKLTAKENAKGLSTKTSNKKPDSETKSKHKLLTDFSDIIEAHDLTPEKTAQSDLKKPSKKRKLKNDAHVCLDFITQGNEIQTNSSDNPLNKILENQIPQQEIFDLSPKPLSRRSSDDVLVMEQELTYKAEKSVSNLHAAVTIEQHVNDPVSDVQPNRKTTVLSALTTQKNIVQDVEMMTSVSENIKRTIDAVQPKQNVMFYYFGSLSKYCRVFENSVELISAGCQTDELCNKDSVSIYQVPSFPNDDAQTVHLTLKSKLDDDIQIFREELNTKLDIRDEISMTCKADTDKKEQSCSTLQQLTATSSNVVQPQQQFEIHSIINNEDKTSVTPTKPPKRRKTKRGLASALRDRSNIPEINIISPPTSEVKFPSAKTFFDFSPRKTVEQDLDGEQKQVEVQSYGVAKNPYRRLKMLSDSDSESQQFKSTFNPKEMGNTQKPAAQIFSLTQSQESRQTQKSSQLFAHKSSFNSTPKRRPCEPMQLSEVPIWKKENHDPWVEEMDYDDVNAASEIDINVVEISGKIDPNKAEEIPMLLDDNEELNENSNLSSVTVESDEECEDLLYSSTPIKKPNMNKEESRLRDIDEFEDNAVLDFSPSGSAENISTQSFLKLKAQIQALEQKKRLMEKELEVAETETITRSKNNSSLSKSEITADQSLRDVSKTFHKQDTSPKTTGLTTNFDAERTNQRMVAPKGLCNIESLEVDTIVSQSPQPKVKWTPGRVTKSEVCVNLAAVETSKSAINSVDTPVKELTKESTLSKSYSFVATGLLASQLKQVKQLAQVLNGNFSSTFTRNATTHVIVSLGHNRLCERTLKYLMGIACRRWIVSFNWVADSLAAGKGLPEEDYEALGDNNDGVHRGPTKARLNPIPILKHFKVVIMEPFKDLTKDQISALLESCGAEIVSHPSQMDTNKSSKFKQLIIADKTPNDKMARQYNDISESYGLTVVSRDWLLDSVASNTVKPPDNYILSPIDSPPSPRLQ